MYSAYKLNTQGDNIQPWCTPFPIWNQSVVPCPVLTVASWPVYRFSQEVGPVVWNSHLYQNFPQFVVIHTVKGCGIVNKAEVDVFSGTLLLFRWFNRCWQFPLTQYFPIPYFPQLLHILPEPSFFKLLILYWSIDDERYCDSFRWIIKGLSHTYTCIHSPLNSPPIQAATKHWAEFLVLYSRTLLVIYFKYSRENLRIFSAGMILITSLKDAGISIDQLVNEFQNHLGLKQSVPISWF